MGWRSSLASWSEKITSAIFVHCRSIRTFCRLLCFFSFGVGCFSFLDSWKFFSHRSSTWQEVDAESKNGLPSRDSALQIFASFGLGQAGSGWVEVPDLRGQFAFVSLAARPDISQEKTEEIYIYLTKSKKVLKAFSNVDYFFVMQGSALVPGKEFTSDTIKVSFSRIKEEIWVKFFFMNQENMFSELKPEDLFYPLSLVKVQDKEASGFEVQYLSSIGFQWAGKDTLLEQRKGLIRQYICLARGKIVEKSLHLELGDCLFKEDEEWLVSPPGERTRGKIIFQLEEVTDNRLFFSVWDLQGRVKKGLYLSKIQESLDIATVREIRLSAVRSPEHIVLQLKQERLFVHLGDYLILEGYSPDKISFKVADKTALHKPGLYLWVKWIGRIEGKWQVETHVYSEMRSKFVSCLITDNGFGYKNFNQESRQLVSHANYLFGESLLFASFSHS